MLYIQKMLPGQPTVPPTYLLQKEKNEIQLKNTY